MANYRNPNGYGSVTKLSGKRRRPFVVRKTVGYDDRAYPIYSVIGYYETRKEAMIALAEYNHEPYDIELAKITFAELYERWSKTELPKLGKSLVANHKAAYKHCSSLYGMQYSKIRKFDMQRCIDECGRGCSTQANIRNLLATLDKYAYDQDIVKKCYSNNLTVKLDEAKKERVIFTDDEVRLLHAHEGEPYVDEALFMLYTGCRISEMLTMKSKDVDLDQGIMRGGIKTAAGKNRVIPIHSRIQGLVRRHLADGSEYLFAHERSATAADKEQALVVTFSKRWTDTLAALCMNHTSHECRHTFRSKLDSSGANKVSIDLIMGHKSEDIGERVYTHKTIGELKSAVEKLRYC